MSCSILTELWDLHLVTKHKELEPIYIIICLNLHELYQCHYATWRTRNCMRHKGHYDPLCYNWLAGYTPLCWPSTTLGWHPFLLTIDATSASACRYTSWTWLSILTWVVKPLPLLWHPTSKEWQKQLCLMEVPCQDHAHPPGPMGSCWWHFS
jgi:hypothetical protein